MASSSSKASSGLTKDFLGASTIVMREITEALDGNLELQCIVKARIKDYQDTQKSAEASGTSVQDMVQNTSVQDMVQEGRGGRHAGLGASDEEEQAPAGDPRHSFAPRSARLRRMDREMCKALFEFVDLDLDMTAIGAMKQEAFHECMERAFELKLFGDLKDRAGIVDSQRKLFENLRQVYVAL